MKIVSRYLLQEFRQPFFLALIFFLFLLSLGGLFQLADLIVSGVLPFLSLLHYWVLMLFILLPYGLALATLVGATLTFTRISQDRELTALKSLGIPFIPAIRPLLVLAVFLSFISFGLVGYLQPYSKYRGRLLVHQAQLNLTTAFLKPGSVVTEFPGIIIFIPNRGEKKPITIYQKEAKAVRVISAQSISLQKDANRLYLLLEDGLLQVYQPQRAEVYQQISFRRYRLALPGPQRSSSRLVPKITELNNRSLTTLATPAAFAELQKRLAFAFAPLLFLLIGIPLGVAIHKSLWSVSAACLLVTGYYFGLSGLEALSRLKPSYASLFWLLDLLLLLVGVYCLRRLQ